MPGWQERSFQHYTKFDRVDVLVHKGLLPRYILCHTCSTQWCLGINQWKKGISMAGPVQSSPVQQLVQCRDCWLWINWCILNSTDLIGHIHSTTSELTELLSPSPPTHSIVLHRDKGTPVAVCGCFHGYRRDILRKLEVVNLNRIDVHTVYIIVNKEQATS